MKLTKLLQPLTIFKGVKKNPKKLATITIISLVAILAAYFTWKKKGVPKLNRLKGKTSDSSNKELVTSTDSASIYYFYTEWCPYCKKAQPEWGKLKDVYSNKTINGYNLEFKEVDCDKDEATATEFKVEGYPTIILVKNGQKIVYDAKPKFETLETFVKTSL